MTCAVCQSHVANALSMVPGVSHVNVNLLTHEAVFHQDSAQSSVSDAVTAVRAAGYDASELSPSSASAPQTISFAADRSKALQVKRREAILCLLAAGVGMLLSMPLMHTPSESAHDSTLLFISELLTAPLQSSMPWLFNMPPEALSLMLLALTIAVVVGPGREFFIYGFRSLLARRLDMNVLVALGAGSSIVLSLFALAFPAPFSRQGLGTHVYFEAALFILAFLKLGRFLEARSTYETVSALGRLNALRPATARKVIGSEEEIVTLDEVRVGDVLRVRPDDRVPLDGRIISGESAVDESLITGESVPLSKKPGDLVIGGSLNGSGVLEIRIDSPPERGVLDQLLALARESQAGKPAIQELADRFSAWLIPAILLVACVTFLAWWILLPSGGLLWGLYCAIAVMVVSCPCAMGLATPIALLVTSERAAKSGILIKGGVALESAARLTLVILDKTGTLTEGRPAVSAMVAAAGATEGELLQVAASLSQHSSHPFSSAIVARARSAGLILARSADSRSVSGSGISGFVKSKPVVLGSRQFLIENSISLESLDASVLPPGSHVYVARAGVLLGVIALQDKVLPHARRAVELLEALSLKTLLASGDRSQVTKRVAEELRLREFRAELRPEDKLALVTEQQRLGEVVAMIGDGANDALALAKADVGIAVAKSADVASHHADITLMRPDPRLIAEAVSLSRAAVRIMRQNLMWAAGYNLICIPIATGVFYPFFGLLLSPMLASAAMAASSLSVVLNSLLLRRS